MASNCKYNYPQIARDSGFKLQKCRSGTLDWSLIGSLEVEDILREQQFEKIDSILSYFSEAPLASILEISILDSNVGKYIYLSQLAMQYLIFCRKFLDESVTALRESLVKLELENGNLKAINQEHSDELIQLHKKISHLEAMNEIVFPCHICTKNFVSNDALNIHLIKKHSNTSNDFQGMKHQNDVALINTIKLELEIKHLKERLNSAEKDIKETSEIRKRSPKKCTLIDTLSVEMGTQCNLFETKELDSSNDIDMKLLISKLEKKVLILESTKEASYVEKNDIIDGVAESVREINNSIHSKYDQDLNILKKNVENAVVSLQFLNEIVPTSTKELQSFLATAVSDLMQHNSEKLNEILFKIDTSHEQSLQYLRSDILQDKIKTYNNIQNISVDPLIFENPTDKDMNSHIEDPMSNKKDVIRSSLSRTAHVIPLKNSEINNIFVTEASQTEVASEMLAQKLAVYGVDSNAKAISGIDAANITSNLKKERSNIKKINPRFITTRDKLERFVNISCNGKIKEHSLKVFKSQFMNLSNQVTEINGFIGNESFKQLEKILCSPIKKPSAYSPSHKSDSIKPIPLPRKRVVFQQGNPTFKL